MANLRKGNYSNDFAAPATYDHGVPQPSGQKDYQNNGYNSGNNNYGGYNSYEPETPRGEYVEPEIYEEGSRGYSNSYSGGQFEGGFQNPTPQTQRSNDRYTGSQYGGSTGYADPRYSNQQFVNAGANTGNQPFQNQQSFDPQMNNGAYNQRSQPNPMPNAMPNYGMGQPQTSVQQKFCKWCASAIPVDAVVCTNCGRQVEELKQQNAGMGQPQVYINNNNNNVGMPMAPGYGYVPMANLKDKTTALLLCFFGGLIGLHKFYEGKVGMGLLYFFTGGLCGIGALIDFITLLGKPSKYLP